MNLTLTISCYCCCCCCLVMLCFFSVSVVRADVLQAAGVQLLSKIGDMSLDEAQKLLKKSYANELKQIQTGVGYTEVGTTSMVYVGKTKAEGLPMKIEAMKRSLKSTERLKSLINPQTDLLGEGMEVDYLLFASTKGHFSMEYIYFAPSAEPGYFDVSCLSVSGTMALFPNTWIETKTKSNFFKTSVTQTMRYEPRPVTMDDIANMWALMTYPLANVMKVKLNVYVGINNPEGMKKDISYSEWENA